MPGPSRTLEELVAICRLEPFEFDIIVRSESHKRFIDWLLRQLGVWNATTYPVSMFDVPQVGQVGPHCGDRERLIGLAAAVARATLPVARLTCIVDQEFDGLLDRLPQSRHVVATDYTSLEMYLVSEDSIARMLLHCELDSSVARELILAVAGPAVDLFHLRAAAVELGIELPDVTLREFLEMSAGVPACHLDALIKALVREEARRTVAADRMAVLRGRQARDVRARMYHGDFVEVLCWFLTSKYGANQNWTPERLMRVLWASGSPEVLRKEMMVSRVLRRNASLGNGHDGMTD